MFDGVLNGFFEVPHFQRMSEYFGTWLYEPERFLAQWMLIQRTDLMKHAAEVPKAPRADAQPQLRYTQLMPTKGGKNVAVVKAVGTLMKQESSFGGASTIALRREIRQVANNPEVSSILLAIDSPGGTTAGLADLAADVKAARKKKPVWAHIDDLGASAAYWVASQADVIYANALTALVGSIGTIMTVYDMSTSAEREGVKTHVFATGPLKGAGIPGTALSEEQRAYFQGIVDQTQLHFDAAVQAGRGMTSAELAKVKTGGVFLAAEAKRLKLIDGIRPLDNTLAELASAK